MTKDEEIRKLQQRVSELEREKEREYQKEMKRLRDILADNEVAANWNWINNNG